MKIKNKVKVKQRNVNQLMALLVTVAVLFITVASPISFALENPKSRQPQIIGIEELREGDEVVLVEKNSDSTKTEALTQNNAVETIDLKNIDEKFKFSFMKKNEDGTMVFSPGERLLSGEEIEKYDVYLVFRDTKEKQEAVEEKDKTEQKNADEEVMQEITENTEKETDSLAAADEEQTEEMFNLHVEEKWDDNNNAAGKRPQEIEVRLFANDTFADKTLKLSEENAWKGSFKNLPVEKDGEKISYTVTAEVPEEYESQTVYSEKNAESEDVHVRAASVDEKKKDVNDSNAVITCTYKGKKELESHLICKKQIDAFGDDDNNPDTELDDKAEDKEDLYRLYLTTRAEYEETPVDFLFVIDRSGSMANRDVKLNHNIVRRDKAVHQILNGKNGIVAKALEMNPQNMVAAVGFYGEDSLGKDLDTNIISPWTRQSSEWDTRSKKAFVSGTNYAAGFYRANELLKDRKNSKHEKVVIFLSDGVPTYYLSGYEKGDDALKRHGTGNYNSKRNTQKCIDPSKKAFDWFLQENPGIKVYCIGISEDLQGTGKSSSPEVLEYYAEKSKGLFVHATEGDDIVKAFKDIIDFQAYKNIEINDELSEYVKLHNTFPDIKITSVEKNTKKQKVLWENKRATEEGKNIIKSVKETEKGKITAEFEPDYKLTSGTDYILSYNVQTTPKAVEEYSKTGYTHIGDQGTDFGNNKTSSGQAGFYSSNNAEVLYMHGGTNENKIYPKPVVQSRANEKYTVKKIWDDRFTSHNPIKVKLRRNGKILENKTVTLSEENNWKHEWENLPEYSPQGIEYRYSVSEENVPENYQSQITGGKDCPEIPLQFTSSEKTFTEETNFNGEKHYLITAEFDGETKILSYRNHALSWITYDGNPGESEQWYYSSSRYLTNSGHYLCCKKKKELDITSKKPECGRFGIKNGHLYAQKKSGETKYYLTDNGWDMDKSKHLSESEMLDITLYGENEENLETVQGDKKNFYIVNKESDEPAYEVKKPYVEKQIDSLQNNKENSQSYNYEMLQDGTFIGTQVSGWDDYRLKLTLSGSDDDRGVDVLFVVDNTTSMKDSMGKKRRIDVADEIINGTKAHNYENGMLHKVLNINPKNKVAVTTFAGTENYATYEDDKDDYNPILVEWTGNNETLKPYPDREIKIDGKSGTNYMGALLRADEMINSPAIKNDGNFKAVIFLTDGEPNSYIKEHHGKHAYLWSSDSIDLEKLCVEATEEFHHLNKYVSFDTIGVGNPKEFGILKKMAKVAGGMCYTAETEGQFIDSISNIISRYYPERVQIVDPLSQYVELNKVPDLEIIRKYKVKDGNFKTEVVWSMDKNSDYTSTGNIGYATKYNQFDGEEIIDSVTYNKAKDTDSTGKIHVMFNPSYKIGANNIFELRFNVKVSEYAKKEFRNQGYPKGMIGDADTDCDLNSVTTSSEKPGFFANAFGDDKTTKAKLIYRQNSEKDSEMLYPKPVVQAYLDYNLPSTGSPLGTWFYTIFGTFLMTSAVLFFKKEKH